MVTLRTLDLDGILDERHQRPETSNPVIDARQRALDIIGAGSN